MENTEPKHITKLDTVPSLLSDKFPRLRPILTRGGRALHWVGKVAHPMHHFVINTRVWQRVNKTPSWHFVIRQSSRLEIRLRKVLGLSQHTVDPNPFAPSDKTNPPINPPQTPKNNRYQNEQQRIIWEAILTNDDEQIEKVVADLGWGQVVDSGISVDALNWLEDSKKRLLALRKLCLALLSDNDLTIINSYDSILTGSGKLRKDEETRVETARYRNNAHNELHQAIATDDDDLIDPIRLRYPFLETYTSVLPQDRARVDLAQQRIAAWRLLRTALDGHDDDAIAKAYVPLLHRYRMLSQHDVDRIDLANTRLEALRLLREALTSNDEVKIADAYVAILHDYKKLTEDEKQRAELAVARVVARDKLRIALESNNDERIASAYNPILDGSTIITEQESERVQLANRRLDALFSFREMLKTGDDDFIAASYDSVLDGYASVSAQERERLNLAVQTNAALACFWSALKTRDEDEIVKAYNPILDNCKRLSSAEKNELSRSKTFIEAKNSVREALQSENDAAIAAVDARKLNLVVRRNQLLTQEEQKRIALAISYQELRNALRIDNELLIVERFTDLLKNHKGITADDLQHLDFARRRIQALTAFTEALRSGDDDKIVAAYQPILGRNNRRRDFLSPAQRSRYQEARHRKQRLEQLRQALNENSDDEAIMSLYTPNLYGISNLNINEQHRLQTAIHRTELYKQFKAAIDSGVEQRIVDDYDNSLNDYPAIAPDDRARLELARKRMQDAYVQQQVIHAGAKPGATIQPEADRVVA